MTKKEPANLIHEFFRLETAGGILLISAAALAILFANTPLSSYYELLLDTVMQVRIGNFEINKPLLLWINDGLMAIFFFTIGLELKRELVEGELSDLSSIVLPAVGAVGGMVVPSAIYLAFNHDNPVAMQGWAIPAATDIAFALGVLSLLGSRVPISIKIFLTSLAIFDDVGAIVIIALFYTANISMGALIVVAACLPVLFIMNKKNITKRSAYIFVGIIMWVATLKSGVHATLAGIVLAMFIPMRSNNDPSYSPLKSIEHDLHPLVSFLILPVFAFANAGLDLRGISTEQVMHDVPLGVAAGLFAGKQIGIFFFCWVVVALGFAQLPKPLTWPQIYGTSALCGIGFTMSLFIGGLAFEETGVNLIFDERLGIIVGSIASGIVGFLILHLSLPKVGTSPTLES